MSLAKATAAAVHDALATIEATGGRVYDRVPSPAPKYPYFTYEIDVRDDGNTCSNSSEVHTTVHLWSNAVGRQQAQDIMEEVRELLAPDDPDETLAIEGYRTEVSAFDLEIYRQTPDPLITEGVSTFTHLVDPE